MPPSSRAHQQLAVDRAVEVERVDEIGEGRRKCRRRSASRAAGTPPSALGLHADAVPFPLGDVVGRVEPAEVAVLERHATASPAGTAQAASVAGRGAAAVSQAKSGT